MRMLPAMPDGGGGGGGVDVGGVAEPSALAAARRYVSMFRIDGVPILPPLMTSEKRRQMQKLKEKALKIESNLAAQRRQRQPWHNDDDNGGGMPQCSRDCSVAGVGGGVSNSSSSSDGSMSQQSFEFDVQRLKREQELHESYRLLTDLMQRRDVDDDDEQAPVTTVASSSTLADSNSLTQRSEGNLAARMQKLAKSETIIYDNRANTIIMPMTASDYQHMHDVNANAAATADADADEQANMSASMSAKAINLAVKRIPSICVDPPTPLGEGVARGFCGGHTPDVYAPDQLSSDESSTNVVQQRVTIQSPRSPPHSERQHTLRAANLRPPQRSATSPQLKLSPERVAMHSSTRDHNAPHNSHSECPLVRSNSFTLACPSRALLEHIRRQKAACVQQRRTTFSASATRDTVESKAKRVQKVDLKSRAPASRGGVGAGGTGGGSGSQRKATLSNYSYNDVGGGGAGAGNSPHFKSRRSPYEAKCTPKPKLARPLKKSTSSSSGGSNPSPISHKQHAANVYNPKLIASSSNKKSPTPSATSTATTTITTSTTFMPPPPRVELPNDVSSHEVVPVPVPVAVPAEDKQLLTQFETDHHQRLLQLIAQQQAEQQRLQATFEAQQQELLAQLSSDLCNMPLPSERDGTAEWSETSPQPKSERSEYVKSSPSVSVASTCSTARTISHNNTTTPSTLNNNNTNNQNSTLCGIELPSLDMSITSTASSTLASTPLPSGNGRATPRRRLFAMPRDESAVELAQMMPPPATVPAPTVQTPNRCQRRRNLEAGAATIINAFARGFLVRRLFQTEQIQRIVQTIRDTLIFVLNLHMETLQNASEANTLANIKLKARLLQQLSSATRTLHLVFFQTTVKERMDIIARDRKRIKTKLMALNLKR